MNIVAYHLFHKSNLNFDFPSFVNVVPIEYSVGENATIENDNLFSSLINNVDSKIDLVFINASGVDYYANNLSAHIRLAENKYISNAPIILLGDTTLFKVFKRKSAVDKSVLLSNTILFFENYKQLSLKEKESILDDQKVIEFLHISSSFQSDFLEVYSPKNLETKGRHSVANLWGAHRLKNVLGETSSQNNSLLFKYYSKKHSSIEQISEVELSEFQKKINNANILYIDDETDLWKDSLKLLIGEKATLFECPVDSNKSHSDIDIELFVNEVSENDINVVILDLRLLATDNSQRNISDYLSTSILKNIKETHQHVSVVVFTASNKAWNQFQMINNYGADGYYIKESPEFLPSQTYSLDNTKKLMEIIQKACKRSRNLSLYWDIIVAINSSIDKDVQVEDEMKALIKDRLNVVFSLISLEYRRSVYEQKKSDYKAELAFVSLWGLMNLLYELYFEKIECSRSKKNLNLIQNFVPNSLYQSLRKDKVELVKTSFNDQVFFIKDGDNNQKYYLTVSSNGKGKIKFHELHEGKKSDTQRVYLQIGFLIYQLDLESSEKLELIVSLDNLNRFRNKLAIIHGVELEEPILNLAASIDNDEILDKTLELFKLFESIFTAYKKKKTEADKLDELIKRFNTKH